MSGLQRYRAERPDSDGRTITPDGLDEDPDGPAVLFADVEPVLRDQQRLDWVLPIVSGSDEATANRRTLALAIELISGKQDRELIDAAMARCPQ